jgi:hypothetical protein
MSLTQPVLQAVVKAVEKSLDSSIDIFISRIATKYNIEKSLLSAEWTGCNKSGCDADRETEGCVDPEELLNANKADLTRLCKSRGLPCSGTKESLRVRLLSYGKDDKTSTENIEKKPQILKKNSILDKLMQKRPLIVPVVSEFGNWVHVESGLVFDTNSRLVIGHENAEGGVDDLTSKDIEQCNRYGLNFVIPENLDKKIGLSDVHVEGMNDDEEEIVDEDTGEDIEEEIVDELIEEELLEEFGGEESDEELEEYEEYEDE